MKNNNLLMSFLDAQTEIVIKNSNRYSPKSIARIITLKRHLIEFINKKGTHDVALDLIDTTFIREFDDHLVTWKNPSMDRAMNRNSAYKHHSTFKALLNTAQHEQHISHNPYQKFKLKMVVQQSDFLSEEEIIKISGLQIDNQPLELTRDYLLFILWAGGVRISDLYELKSHNIFEECGFYYLQLPAKSNCNFHVCTPLLPEAVNIFKKYKAYQDETGFLLPRLSQQKLNANLKTIGELAGVNRAMTYHIARHSWNKTICSRNSVPPHVISNWSGRMLHSRTIDSNVEILKEESFYWLQKLYEIYNKPEFTTK